MTFVKFIVNVLLIIQVVNFGVCYDINNSKKDTLAPESFFKQQFIKNNSNVKSSFELQRVSTGNKVKLIAKTFIRSYLAKLSISIAMITLFSSGVLFAQSSSFQPKIAKDTEISEFSRNFLRKELGSHEKLPKRRYIINEDIRTFKEGILIINDGWAMTRPGEGRSPLLVTVNVNDCVVLILYDKSTKTASLAHITRETEHLGYKGLKESLDKIINSMNENGAEEANYSALMVGGHTGSSELLIQFLEDYLKEREVSNVKQDLGGNGGLNFLFNSENGELYFFDIDTEKIYSTIKKDGLDEFDSRNVLEKIAKKVQQRSIKTETNKTQNLDKEKVYRWGKDGKFKTGKGLSSLGNNQQRMLNKNQIKAYTDIFSKFEETASRRKLVEVQEIIENYKDDISAKDYDMLTSLVSLKTSNNSDIDNRKLIFYRYFQELLSPLNVDKGVGLSNSSVFAYAS